MKMKRFFFAGLFLMSGLTIVTAQVKLSFNPPKGAKYEYRSESVQTAKQNVMGQEMKSEIETDVTYIVEIKDKTSQGIHVQLTYRDFAYIMSSPMMKMGYDSKNPIENPSEMDQMLAKMFSGMIGQPCMLVIAPDGSVKSVTGMDAIAENMLKALSDNGQIALQIGASLQQQFGDEAMKNSFQQSFKIYPDNAVKPGDSWNMENLMTVANMNTAFHTKYTLKEVSRNMATVAVESDIEMIPGEGMEGKITGTQAGSMRVDTTTGIQIMSDLLQNMNGVINAQGFGIQMEVVGTVKTSIKEVK